MTNAPRPASRALRALAAAALVALVAGCLPAPGLQADGSVLVHAERAGDGWVAEVPVGLAGRALEVRRPFAAPVVVPRGFVPPPGTCRTWRPNVAPALQTPFEACPTLDPAVPAGAYLIRG